MEKIWYLIPSDLMEGVTQRLDDAGVSFHVMDREELAEKIAAAFPEVEVKISETHSDCVKFY